MSWVESLDELAVREAAAVDGRRWDELVAIQDERHDLLLGLPQPLPASCRPVLERALAASLATQDALAGPMAETKGAIERLRGGRRALGAYGAGRRNSLERRA